MNNEELQQLNKKGLIPGPDEAEEEFQQRASYCLELKNTMPYEEGPFLERAAAITYPLYSIDPKWIPIMFSNHKLSPWHGGCAWIFKMDDKSPIGAYLQMRSAFKNHDHYLGLYDRKDLIAHEVTHIGRMAFDEPIFEEFFAWRVSKGWRRLIGPIVKSSTESMLFVLSLILVLFADSFALFIDPKAWAFANWLKLVPATFIIYGLTRLFVRHYQLNRCLKVLKELAGEKAEAIAYRMTDQEIINCTSKQAFINYAKAQNSLRWRVINLFECH